MKKLFVYSDQNDNNSLGQIAHLLINSGFAYFKVGLTRLEFEETQEDLESLKQRITEKLIDEIHFISIQN